MSQPPLFSIITVTLNNAAGLEKTHSTIQEQTNTDYEWLVVDGGSTDETLPYLKSVQSSYISEEDRGIYDAMNKGLIKSTGHYIIFMNAGDCFESKNTLQETADRIKGGEYDFIYGDSAEIKDEEIFFKRSRPHTKITQGMFTHHQAMFYNRKILDDLAYDTLYLISADYDLTWRALNKSKDILYLPFPICLFEAGGLSQQRVLLGRIEQFRIRRNHKISFANNIWIFIKQTLAYNLRKISPKIYWLLKRR